MWWTEKRVPKHRMWSKPNSHYKKIIPIKPRHGEGLVGVFLCFQTFLRVFFVLWYYNKIVLKRVA